MYFYKETWYIDEKWNRWGSNIQVMTFPSGSILIAFLTIPWQRMKYTHSFLYHEFEWGLNLELNPHQTVNNNTIRRLRSLRNSSIRTDSDQYTLKAFNTNDKLIWSLSERICSQICSGIISTNPAFTYRTRSEQEVIVKQRHETLIYLRDDTMTVYYSLNTIN